MADAERDGGFYNAVRTLWMQPCRVLPEHLGRLPEEFARQATAQLSSEDAVVSLLERLQIPPDLWEETIVSELLALPGWAGLMSRLEEDPGLAPRELLRCSLMDLLAVG
ncbi:MAG: putative inorganic carbon transporter subunit DabA [Bryobacteraceae bacterium]